MKWEALGFLRYRIIAKIYHALLCCHLRHNIKGNSKSRPFQNLCKVEKLI